MRLFTLQCLAILIALAMQASLVDARGGGKSGGGKSGGSSGGSSSGRGTSVPGSTTGSSYGATQPRSGPVSYSGNYHYPPNSQGFTKGGYGSFSGPPPPYSIATTRATYPSFQPTYTGGYGAGSNRAGWVGYYNPYLLYWSITPVFLYLGFHSAYHRYNQNEGSYYAPILEAYTPTINNAIVNGTEYTSEEDNYYYTFNMTTGYTYAMADHGFFGSSDHNAHPADLAFRMTFSHIIEWDDANQNGFYDDGEALLAATSLAGLSWQPLTAVNKGTDANATLTYYEMATAAQNLTRNNNSGNATPFSVHLTWRSSNLQINMTQGVPIQPNSLWYNVSLPGYPTPTASNTRLGLAQWITLPVNTTMMLDVNTTTPLDIAQQIKSNQTYGASIGDYNEARLEYDPAVNITRVTQPRNNISLVSDDNTSEWIWGDSLREASLLLLSMPLSLSSTPQLTGFSFLDVNVMCAESAVAAASMPISAKSMLLVILTASCTSFLII